ncbi:RagB/SusD family nutrient uptake outer membrane protein [Pelobium sp.]|nr:RagB/SusD family nutrient uptake outer membrane protein [Pelobium sp.]MDA9555253.1 RagB/SusD family nutrient uptake outer membrane protein [Pelobium sp.]
MKNKIKIFIISVITLGLFSIVSCEDRLNIQPQTQLTDLKTFSDIKSALNGCYLGFKSASYYNNTASSGTPSAWSALPDLMGDDFIEALESLGNWRQMSEMSYNSDNSVPLGAYRQPYEIISRANNILESIAPFELDPTTKTEAAIIKAQVLAIRAHAHFDLMRYFAPDFARNSTSLAIPYVKTFDALNPFSSLPSRNTVKEVYDNIYSDLNASLIEFRKGGNLSDNTSRNFIDSVTVYAMRTRVNYYASQWTAVISDANIVLSNRPVSNSSDYVAVFSTAGEATPPSEVIWAIPSDAALSPGGAISGANPNYRVATPLSNIIQSLGGVYVNTGINRFNQVGNGGFQRTLCWKYPGVRSFKVFRAGEILLMRAEAKQRVSDLTALTDLNSLRINRDVAIGVETGTALLDAITLLRRVELLGEGHRWFDLKRTTKSINRTECGVTGASTSNTCVVAPTSRAWAFPIPFNERKVNPNLVQNAGYDN